MTNEQEQFQRALAFRLEMAKQDGHEDIVTYLRERDPLVIPESTGALLVLYRDNVQLALRRIDEGTYAGRYALAGALSVTLVSFDSCALRLGI